MNVAQQTSGPFQSCGAVVLRMLMSLCLVGLTSQTVLAQTGGSTSDPAPISSLSQPVSKPALSQPIAKPELVKPAQNQASIFLKPAPKISVLTFGPGGAAFLKFGHNAIRVQDPETRTDFVYNFGTFRFDNPFLILDFLTGRFQYWLSVTTFERTLAYYRQADRDVTEQHLNLGHQTAHELSRQLRENARPENRAYLYDYYRDNCSTRVRDAIDAALKGGLQKRSLQPGQMTLRDHTLRAVADDFWLYLGLDIAMGSYIDQPETRWSEMFLPQKLQDGLDRVVFAGVHGKAALVKQKVSHHRSHTFRKLRRQPPERTFDFLKAGIVIGALIAFFGWEAYRRRKDWARALLSVCLAVFGLVSGLLGCLFLGLWLGTNHVVAFRNENVLQCAPFALVLPVCAWGVFRSRPAWLRIASLTAQAALAASIVGLVLKVFPFMHQQNERIIALCLPIWCGIVFALHLMRLRALKPLSVLVDAEGEDESPSEDEQEADVDEESDEDEEEGPLPVDPNSQPAPA